ncbi:MAG: hypothetical protein MUE41_13925, partial [Gemmatimonadaceae bacterium]|nr:hypothetical protein [Gemmatimonadaceae bacterium]
MSEARRPRPFDPTDPTFHIPEWASIGQGELAAEDLARHVLVTGETGAGKSVSAILPLLRAALRYPYGPDVLEPEPSPLAPSMLVIDPKRELLEPIRQHVTERRLPRTITALDSAEGGPQVLHLFEGVPRSALTVDVVCDRLFALSPTFGAEKEKTNSVFFINQADVGLRALFSVDLHIVATFGVHGLRRFWRDVRECIRAKVGACPELAYDRANYLAPHFAMLGLVVTHPAVALAAYVAVARAYEVQDEVLLPLEPWRAMRAETTGAVIAVAFNVLKDLAGSLSGRVSLNPFEPPVPSRFFSVAKAL